MKPYKINPDVRPSNGPFIDASELARRTGLSLKTLRRLSRMDVAPRPIGRDTTSGKPLYDLSDRRLTEWIADVTRCPDSEGTMRIVAEFLEEKLGVEPDESAED
jgi:hypothetical protein